MKSLTATHGSETWPVSVEKTSDGGYRIVARGTMMHLHVKPTCGGFLVSIPDLKRCGEVPRDVNARDLAVYCDIDNDIDAATAAAALWAIIAKQVRIGVRPC